MRTHRCARVRMLAPEQHEHAASVVARLHLSQHICGLLPHLDLEMQALTPCAEVGHQLAPRGL
eukprot:1157862-Pelagomonas_calceolata.AAC.14